LERTRYIIIGKRLRAECEKPFREAGLLTSAYLQKQWLYQTSAERVLETYWSALELPANEADMEQLGREYRLNPSIRRAASF
jgi:hypothetical protein